MSKFRLNSHARDTLRALARDLVSCPAEQLLADKAHSEAATSVRKMIETRYPPKDMAVLKRYDQANADLCIRMELTPGGYHVWRFRPTEKAPLQPGPRCQTHIADEAVTEAVQRDIKAEEAFRTAIEKKLKDYNSLISAANTFEAVCEVWPEAERARGQCGASAVVVAVTPDVVERIKADIASRVKESAL